MTEPYKCPVCVGKGLVSCTFYNSGYLTSAADETCRSCNGKGILWPQNSDCINDDSFEGLNFPNIEGYDINVS